MVSAIGVLLLLMACNEHQQYRDALLKAEAVMNDYPDSALIILDSLGQHEKEFGHHFHMQYLLHRTNAQNKTDVEFTSDSLAKDLVAYFDSHGTANERLLAHYLLGRAYSDMGETPKAIDCFKVAISTADTTSKECDFLTMSTVCSQMARLFSQQLLLSYEIEARKQASHYGLLAKDTFRMIFNKERSAGAYILMNKKDTAELIIKDVICLYQKHGYHRYVYQPYMSLIYLLVEQGSQLPEAKRLIDQFEIESGMFDEHHNLPPSKRQFFYYKGKYYEGINKLDSAEYYYRKVYRPNMSPVEYDPMYRGLLSVFKKRHQSDSIAKYAQLYCEANDSSITIKDRDLTAQMAASYNYIHLQQEAYESEIKAYWFKVELILVIALLIILLLSGHIAWKRYKQAQQRKQDEIDKKHQLEIDHLKADFANASIQYGEKLQELRRLDEEHQYAINDAKQQLKESKRESREYKSMSKELSRTLKEANLKYESEKVKLSEEINTLKHHLENLERREEIAIWHKNSIPFTESGIIRRLKLFINKPLKHLSDSDLNLLVQTVNDYYPDLMFDLNDAFGSTLSTYVCILSALDVSSGSISHLLCITSSQVSNLKLDINYKLFGDKTARTLSYNLKKRYNLPTL